MYMLHLCTERVRAEGPLASTGGERERYCSADVTRLLRHCRVPKAVHSAQSPAPRGGEGAPEFTFFCFRFIDGDGRYPLLYIAIYPIGVRAHDFSDSRIP